MNTIPYVIQKSIEKLPRDDKQIVKKIFNGERLSVEDGVRLFEWKNLNLLGALANWKREQMHGNRAYFIHNQHLNNTNVCVLHCKFCSFRRDKDEEGAYSYSIDEIYDRIRNTIGSGINEVHIVNGLHPNLRIYFYETVLRGIKTIRPDLHIKAFTAVEIDFFARRDKISVDQVFSRLQAAGLDSLPGGGAEIFAEEAREKICGEKIEAHRWLEIHEKAHHLGLKSTCTMLYGHIETKHDRIDHMDRLRKVQDRTQGFTCFIPLRFHIDNNALGETRDRMTEMFEDLQNYAVARLFFDNVPHLKAYWIMAGCDTARLALNFGCDDLDGTVNDEKITHMAGAESPVGLARRNLLRMIRESGRDPIERDSLYNVVSEAP